MSRPTLTKSERSEQRILEAAAKCIATIGIHKTTVRRVAAEAGVSYGLVSHYVPKVDDLFRMVIDEIGRRIYARVEAPPPGALPAQRLAHQIRENIDFYLANPDFYKCMILLYYYASFDPELREINSKIVRRAEERFAQDLTEHFKLRGEGIDPPRIRRIATLIHNHLVSGIMKYYTVHPARPPEQHFDEVLETLQRILETPPK